MKFYTREKLEEAKYFLEQFYSTKLEGKKNKFYLSAFLQAWRSVIEYLLYDFARYYELDADMNKHSNTARAQRQRSIIHLKDGISMIAEELHIE